MSPRREAGTAEASAERLLERAGELSALEAALSAAAGGTGRLVLVGGEAGVGKTALAHAFCEGRGDKTRVLWGACDALFTPRPLVPLVDVARSLGGQLDELVTAGARAHDVTAALLAELARRPPTVLVLEDLHGADEATLDVLTLLGRRIEGVPALVIATYRDDELDRAHPLRIVLGELATERAVERLKLAPLSERAVWTLAESYDVDAEALHRTTAGNPFFVTEVLAAGGEQAPATVREAVLGRAARLGPDAAAVLEVVAVVPQRTELWLLEALDRAGGSGLGECIASGMLTSSEGAVAFRHELARLVVERSLSPDRRLALNRQVLAALVAAGENDLARLAHHADEAADSDAVRRFATAAADQASRAGAHREAAAQYARALRFAEGFSPELRADLHERYAYECYVNGQLEDAVAAQRGALDGFRATGAAPGRVGDALRSLSRLERFLGRTGEAERSGLEAVALLEPLGPSRELGLAYCNVSHIRVTAEDKENAIAWAERALAVGRDLGDPEVDTYALTNLGAAQYLAGDPAGGETLARSLDLALRADLEELAGRAFLNLVWWPVRQRDFALAERHLEPGIAYCREHGLDLWRLFLLTCRARLALDRGHLDEAAQAASSVLADPRTFPVPRTVALSVLALARARRGEPGVRPLLDEAHALAEPTGELQRIGWVAAATAEAAWLDGSAERVGEATHAALELAAARGASWVVGELVCWRRRAGLAEEPPSEPAPPYALQLNGEHTQAAALWSEIGCPYESALALADSDDEDTLRRGLEELQALGARPAASIVARRLRERGARGLPRGPRPATMRNPAGLTSRELEVLALVATGLTNADIAARLFVSEKTVAHHVSSVLRKLDVRTRGQAGAEAVRLGLTAQDR